MVAAMSNNAWLLWTVAVRSTGYSLATAFILVLMGLWHHFVLHRTKDCSLFRWILLFAPWTLSPYWMALVDTGVGAVTMCISCNLACCFLKSWEVFLGTSIDRKVKNNRINFVLFYAVFGDFQPPKWTGEGRLVLPSSKTVSSALRCFGVALIYFVVGIGSITHAIPRIPVAAAFISRHYLVKSMLLCYVILFSVSGGYKMLEGVCHLAGARFLPGTNYAILSTSPHDFWSRRYNLHVRSMFHRIVFRPLRKLGTPVALAGLVVFICSGIWHEYIVYLGAASLHRPTYYGTSVLYFFIHGILTGGHKLIQYHFNKSALWLKNRLPGLVWSVLYGFVELKQHIPDAVWVVLWNATMAVTTPLLMGPLIALGVFDGYPEAWQGDFTKFVDL